MIGECLYSNDCQHPNCTCPGTVGAKLPIREVAWLIEVTSKRGVPNYFQLEFDHDWTPDANKALRFARKQDAQAYIDHVGWTAPRAVEHMWLGGPTDAIDTAVTSTEGK